MAVAVAGAAGLGSWDCVSGLVLVYYSDTQYDGRERGDGSQDRADSLVQRQRINKRTLLLFHFPVDFPSAFC
jgi:hypothetical protein